MNIGSSVDELLDYHPIINYGQLWQAQIDRM